MWAFGVGGQVLHCASDVVFGKEKYPDAHMRLIFQVSFDESLQRLN